MKNVNEINELINNNNCICNMIYKGEEVKAFENIRYVIKVNNDIFTEFFSLVPLLKQLGVDIPIEVIAQQLNNLIIAYEKHDSMLLADTLRYEINDSLQVYLEILQELEKENIML